MNWLNGLFRRSPLVADVIGAYVKVVNQQGVQVEKIQINHEVFMMLQNEPLRHAYARGETTKNLTGMRCGWIDGIPLEYTVSNIGVAFVHKEA